MPAGREPAQAAAEGTLRSVPRGAADGTVRVAAPAKINLYLHVLGRRPDGLHLLDSLVAFAGVGDEVAATAAAEFGLTVDGPFADRLPYRGPACEENLVLRAARLLGESCGDRRGAALRLTKRLPVAAGLGGGSADAAATLAALVRLWDIDPGADQLRAIAERLGADVPVCLAGRPSFVGGIGEILDPAPTLPPAHLVLINPGVPLPTPAVFAKRAGAFSQTARFAEAPADAVALVRLLGQRRNDLTAAAVELAPAIETVLTALGRAPGCLLARMSGSGATCFGLFAASDAASEAARVLAAAYPGWWVAAAPLMTAGASGGGALNAPGRAPHLI